MTTEFGFCASCGTPRIAADQKFCAVCGSALVPAAPPAPFHSAPPADLPDAPPAWSVPPAPYLQAAPTAPVSPTYQAGPAYSPAPAPSGRPAPTSAARGFKIAPRLLLVGVVVLAVIVGAYLYVSMGSTSGSIAFSPSTVSCSTPVSFTTTAHLSSSVHSGDTITITFDGKPAGSSQVLTSGGDVRHQADGSWLVVSTTTAAQMQSLCEAGGSSGGFDVLTPGTHTMQVLDSSGKVLAQGSYTATP